VCGLRPSVVTLPDGEECFEFGRAERVDDLDRCWLQSLDDIAMRHLSIHVSLHTADFLHPCVAMSLQGAASLLLCRHTSDKPHLNYSRRRTCWCTGVF
jgi:hypothetical protein